MENIDEKEITIQMDIEKQIEKTTINHIRRAITVISVGFILFIGLIIMEFYTYGIYNKMADLQQNQIELTKFAAVQIKNIRETTSCLKEIHTHPNIINKCNISMVSNSINNQFLALDRIKDKYPHWYTQYMNPNVYQNTLMYTKLLLSTNMTFDIWYRKSYDLYTQTTNFLVNIHKDILSKQAEFNATFYIYSIILFSLFSLILICMSIFTLISATNATNETKYERIERHRLSNEYNTICQAINSDNGNIYILDNDTIISSTNNLSSYNMSDIFSKSTFSNVDLEQTNIIERVKEEKTYYFKRFEFDLDETNRKIVIELDYTKEYEYEQNKLDSEKQIIIAKSKLEARQEFLRYAFHEIRNPLQACILSIDDSKDIIKTKEYSELDENITIIDNSISRVGKILNETLDLSKLEAGQYILEMKEGVDIKFLIEDVMELYKIKLMEKNLTYELIGERLYTNCDIDKTKQILVNLIGNSIKFSPHNNKIGIYLNKSTNNQQLMIGIADNGPGVIKELQQQIFMPFTQIEAKRLQNSGGTGLGLSISKKIAENHSKYTNIDCNIIYLDKNNSTSEYMGISNSSYNGAIFLITLPLSYLIEYNPIVDNFPVVYNLPDMVSNTMELEENNKKISELRILVVDDEPILLKLMKIKLKKMGIKTISGMETPTEFLEYVDSVLYNKQQSYDLILLDNRMNEEMLGCEALEIARKRGYNGLIYMCSGDALKTDVDQFMNMGANGFLEKGGNIMKQLPKILDSITK